MHFADVVESTSVFSCEECKFTTDIKQNLTRHINGTHNAKLLFCEECTYSSDRSDTLSRHIKAKHGERISEETLASYVCDECDGQFVTKKVLKQHKQRKHDSSPKKHTAIDELLSRAVSGLNVGIEDMRNVNVAIRKFRKGLKKLVTEISEQNLINQNILQLLKNLVIMSAKKENTLANDSDEIIITANLLKDFAEEIIQADGKSVAEAIHEEKLVKISPLDVARLQFLGNGITIMDEIKTLLPNQLPTRQAVSDEKKIIKAIAKDILGLHRTSTGWAIDPRRLTMLVRIMYDIGILPITFKWWLDGSIVGRNTATMVTMTPVSDNFTTRQEYPVSSKHVFPIATFTGKDDYWHSSDNIPPDSVFNKHLIRAFNEPTSKLETSQPGQCQNFPNYSCSKSCCGNRRMSDSFVFDQKNHDRRNEVYLNTIRADGGKIFDDYGIPYKMYDDYNVDNRNAEEEGLYMCDQCEYKTNNEERLRRHRQVKVLLSNKLSLAKMEHRRVEKIELQDKTRSSTTLQKEVELPDLLQPGKTKHLLIAGKQERAL